MAAILKLRRASTTPNLVKSELFYNEQKETLQIGKNDIASTDVVTLVKLTDVNTGNLQIVGTISGSSLNLSGDITASSAYFKGDVRLDGQIVLGDVPQDNISVNAQFSGSLIPSGSSSTFDLGSQTQYWRNVYATNINGNITDTNLLQFTASQEAKDSTLASYTGSVDTTLSNLATKNNTLGTYTGSIDNKFTTLGTYTGSNDTKWSTLENVTSSLINATGSYATTGSNIFIGNQTITGSLVTTGSKVEFNVAWPTAPGEQHILKTEGFTLDGRTYDYAALALTHYEDSPGTLHNSMAMYMFDPTNTYGSEMIVGPYRAHMQSYPSGSGGNFANISVQDLKNGTTQALVYADYVQIGAFHAESIIIGNPTASIEIRGAVTASNQISAPLFSGSIYGISDTLNFSQSVDFRLDSLEINSGSVNNSITLLNSFSQSEETKNSTLASYTGSVNNQLTELYTTASDHEVRIDGIQGYTSSLKTALELTGSNVTILGNLNVKGTQTVINSSIVQLDDNVIRLNGTGASNGGLLVKDPTSPNTLSGSLLWDTTNDYWKGGPLNAESKLLLAGGDNVVSGSAQVVESLKSTFLEIEGDNVVSGSSQIDLTQTTNYSSGIKDRLNAETVISGSSQVIISESADYVSSIKHRLNIEGVISSSIQIDVLNTTNFTTYSSSVDSKLVQLANDSASQDGRLDNLELFSSSQETKDSTLATYTGSNDTKWSTLENVTSSLINATASYETRGNNIVSGSSQLTESYDLRYANSASFHSLVGAWDSGSQGSIREAAFYNVTSSAQLDTGSITSASLNDTFIFTAGATKEYVNWRTEAILDAIGAADITAVEAGNGLSGGGVSGDVTLTLNTGSTHFIDGVKTKLNIDGVISGSSQIVNILGPLNTFSSSQELKDSTLSTYTGSVNNQLTELYSTASNHEVRIDNLESWSSSLDTLFVTETELTNLSSSIDSRLDNSEAFSSSINTTIKTKLDVEGVISGSSQVLGGSGILSSSNETFNTFSSSVDSRLDIAESFSSSINTTIKNKLDIEGVISGSSQIVNILGPLNTFSASEESKNSTLATYTGSNDTKWSTLGSLSGSFARVDSANTFNGSQIVSGSLTITQDLVVLGSSSIQNISSSRLDIGDNIIQLNVNQPSVRFGGIAVFDSGSAGGSGSFLYDAVQDEFIFVHKGNGTNITSSHFVLGPETIDDLGNELYLTNNRVPKGTGNEHLNDSNITDTGTLITLGSDVVVTGTLVTTGTPLVSGSSQITLSSTIGGGTSANVQFGSLGIGMAASGTTGRIDATNDIVAYSSSDRRFKENITPIENALDKINQIGGYEFDWKDENKIEHGYEGHDLGVIAQEIEMIAPELVQTRENGYKAVKYDKLVSVLIQAVKELSAKVTELENK